MSISKGPQVSHLRNFEHWLIKFEMMPIHIVNQLNRVPGEQVLSIFPFLNMEIIEKYALYLIDEEERAFSYVRDITFSIIGVATKNNVMLADSFFEFKRIKLVKDLSKL